MLKILDTLSALAKDGFRSIDGGASEHFASVGRFLLAVGSLDAELNGLLQSLLNADTAASRAMVGGMRVGDILQSVRRIAVASKIDPLVLSQMDILFAEINRLRGGTR